jgi:8-oxo-dGTP pyrophosphatase MutT (NUDIX family)
MKGPINQVAWMQALSAELPGERAQMRMAPAFRGTYAHARDPVPAAVLILMVPFIGEVRLVFIKRNAYDGPHSAQVSFPGGAREPGDQSLGHTAIRETREELGIHEKIGLLGALTPLHIPVSNYLVTPHVGWMDHCPSFQPDPVEVQFIIEVPVDALLDPVNQGSEIMHRHGQPIVAPYYRAGNEKIWGATAMILSEFLQLAERMQ